MNNAIKSTTSSSFVSALLRLLQLFFLNIYCLWLVINFTYPHKKSFPLKKISWICFFYSMEMRLLFVSVARRSNAARNEWFILFVLISFHLQVKWNSRNLNVHTPTETTCATTNLKGESRTNIKPLLFHFESTRYASLLNVCVSNALLFSTIRKCK